MLRVSINESNAQGVVTTNELAFLKPVFENFNENINKYISSGDAIDLPYYYNERATLSILSAAFWQQNMISIEEYTSPKTSEMGPFMGRTDMWVGCNGQSLCIEAKQRWPSSGDGELVKKAMREVEEDANKNNSEHATGNAGLLFITPSLEINTKFDKALGIANKLAQHSAKNGADIISWWFAKKACENKSTYNGSKRVFPGVLTVLKITHGSEFLTK